MGTDTFNIEQELLDLCSSGLQIVKDNFTLLFLDAISRDLFLLHCTATLKIKLHLSNSQAF